MKNIFKTFILCTALAIGVTGCYDDIDSKSSIDAKYEQSNDVTASLGDVSATSFSEISVSGSLSGVEGVLEAGFMLSNSADFTSYTSYPTAEIGTSFGSSIKNLDELTTYYIRSYAYTISGTKVSEATSVTTPAAPIYELNGTYSATEYKADGSVVNEYDVTIEFVAGSTTDIKITNIYDGGKTIDAKYDPATGKITIPAKQVIYIHASYGDVWMEEVDGGETIAGQFTTKGGLLSISTFSAICDAGKFGDKYIRMNHK